MPMRVLPAICLLSFAACRNPRVDANIADAMTQAGTAITSLQQDQSILQSQIDSLRTVVARQDTIIQRLAAQANLPLPPSR